MIIKKLESVKEHLAFQRLFLSAKHEAIDGRIARASYQYQVGQLAIVESKIIWLQASLDRLCSCLRMLLLSWTINADIDKEEYRHNIRTQLEEMSIPKDVWLSIAETVKIQKLDPWFSKNTNLSGRIIGGIDAYSKELSFYGGTKPKELSGGLNLKDIYDMMKVIKSVNLQDRKSIEHVVAAIGELSVHYKSPSRARFSNVRLN